MQPDALQITPLYIITIGLPTLPQLPNLQNTGKPLPQYLLVIDFGAGTIDVALVELEAEAAEEAKGADDADGVAPAPPPPINGKVLLTDGIVHGAGGNVMTACMLEMVQERLEEEFEQCLCPEDDAEHFKARRRTRKDALIFKFSRFRFLMLCMVFLM